MRILVVGAGAVGVVLTRALEVTKANEVTYLVRAGKKAQLPRVKIVDARSGEIHVREKPAVVEQGQVLPQADTVLFCVRKDQLDEALGVLDALPKDARIVTLTDARARLPGRVVAQVMPVFSCKRDGDVFRLWKPPLAPSLVSWESDERSREFAEEIARDLSTGGLRARAVRKLGPLALLARRFG
jgi:NADPH:quinone reductase-like Zn-dependent oxidoreductase